MPAPSLVPVPQAEFRVLYSALSNQPVNVSTLPIRIMELRKGEFTCSSMERFIA